MVGEISSMVLNLNCMDKIAQMKRTKTAIVHVVWKFNTFFATSFIPASLSLFEFQKINGISIFNNGKTRKNNDDKFNICNAVVSSFSAHSINSLGKMLNVLAKHCSEFPWGSVSPFSIRWMVRSLNRTYPPILLEKIRCGFLILLLFEIIFFRS